MRCAHILRQLKVGVMRPLPPPLISEKSTKRSHHVEVSAQIRTMPRWEGTMDQALDQALP